MPEGDTIFRTAVTLRRVLEGCRIVDALSQRPDIDAASLVDRRVVSVESRGKHLLLHLDDQRCLHSHMGMTGSWHVYGLQDPWKKPQRFARLVLRTENHVAVCFTPKVLELLSRDGLRRHRWLSRLGPDLLSGQFEDRAALRRLRVHNSTPLGEALLNQSVLSGIGNVYKSELLFRQRQNPFAPVGDFSDEQLLRLLADAAELLRRNSGGGMRTTRFRTNGPKLWVYDRAGAACLECGTTIAMRRQGDLGRSTYYCPHCQRTGGGAAPTAG